MQSTFTTIGRHGDDYTDIYTEYLHERGRLLGLNAYNLSTQRALVRICCMARCHEAEDAILVVNAFNSLPLEIKQILRQELCVTGMEPEGAILLYYAPALVNNAWKACNKKFSNEVEKLATRKKKLWKEFKLPWKQWQNVLPLQEKECNCMMNVMTK